MKSEKSLIVSKGVVFGLLSVLLFVPGFAMASTVSDLITQGPALTAMKLICILAGVAAIIDAIVSAMGDQGGGALKKALGGLVLIGLGIQWKTIVEALVGTVT